MTDFGLAKMFESDAEVAADVHAHGAPRDLDARRPIAARATDRDVGVILVAHSMGGFVAADSLFLSLKLSHCVLKVH